MATSWLNQKKPDIRNYIPVYGKVLKPQRTPGISPEKQLRPLKPVLKQSSITDFNMKQTLREPQTEASNKAPAFAFSKGVRRKMRAVECQDPIENENKENWTEPDTTLDFLNELGSRLPIKKRQRTHVVNEESIKRSNPPGTQMDCNYSNAKPPKYSPMALPSEKSHLDTLNYSVDSSDQFIDTNELLADLSNCENMIV